MENSDSRKRPLDSEGESGASKKSNPGSGGEVGNTDEIHLKLLVPSVAAGAVIGKGGEAVGKLQKDTGAKIKMSKNTECYPGTNERVCLVIGTYEALAAAHEFVMDKIKDKPDPNPRPSDVDGRINFERHKQTKILIPNATAGVIIGKGGSYIRELKEVSGAHVQVSQKSKADNSLLERIVTVSGDPENIKKAVGLIVEKLSEDPSSSSCPNVSYGHGAVGEYSYGSGDSGGSGGLGQLGNAQMNPANGAALGQALLRGLNAYGGLNIGSGMNNLNIGSSGSRASEALRSSPAVDNLRGTLRNSGYTETAAEEIALAMATLANYGILGLGLTGGLLGNLMNLNKLSLNGGSSGAGLLGSGSGQGGGDSTLGRGLNSSGGGSSGGGLFGPIGGTASTPVGSLFAGDSLFSAPLTNSRGSRDGKGQIHNSFDFDFDDSVDNSGVPDTTQEVEIAENLVGALIGQGGRGIIELQSVTGTSINVSKKGVFAPGTRNRVVTVTGSSVAANRAVSLIRQKMADAEQRRSAYAAAHGSS